MMDVHINIVSNYFLNNLDYFFVIYFFTLAAKVALWIAYTGQEKRKWHVSAMFWLQLHDSEGVSAKLWRRLWLLKGLRLTLNWKRYRRPTGSCIPKILLVLGRRKIFICFLRISKDGTSSKWLKKMFQEAIALGKKLFLYLFVLHIISRKVLRAFSLNKALQFGGSLPFR